MARSRWAGTLAAMAALGCGENAPAGLGSLGDSAACSIPESQIFNGGPGKDGIPALSSPTMVQALDPGAAYLLPEDRVIGVEAGDEAVAIPLNILWWHEIVNIEVGGETLAVTHCPLTGSSLAFDRGPLGGVEFGVSGLLFQNNLIMYDRSTDESLWPQMSRGARCGPLNGTDLDMVPIVETTWAWWSANHPETTVVSGETGFSRDYGRYPYGFYDLIDNDQVLFPVDIDPRRPPKERVLGVPFDERGAAYPFGELALLGDVGIARHQGGEGIAEPTGTVVFWDASAEAAMAYRPNSEGTELTFTLEDDQIMDNETGSVWRVDGVATSGPLVGRRLEAVAEAYVAYWFAWAAFDPNTTVWRAP